MDAVISACLSTIEEDISGVTALKSEGFLSFLRDARKKAEASSMLGAARAHRVLISFYNVFVVYWANKGEKLGVWKKIPEDTPISKLVEELQSRQEAVAIRLIDCKFQYGNSNITDFHSKNLHKVNKYLEMMSVLLSMSEDTHHHSSLGSSIGDLIEASKTPEDRVRFFLKEVLEE